MDLIPSVAPSDVFASIGAWSAPVFSELFPLALIGVGIFLGGLVVYGIANWVIGGIGVIFYGKGRRGGWEADIGTYNIHDHS